ncbi:S46 family peptidase [bacterium]|nr:S46 family peptidase [bacterium]
MSRYFSVIASLCFLSQFAFADEGMWLFNNLPEKHLKDTYGFEVTPEWKEHAMKSSVRFNVGGSGSFISSDGLVLTNHHVGADALHKSSDAKHDYLKTGFYAKSRGKEIAAKDLELNQLEAITDVTAQVQAAVKGKTGPEAAAARAKVIGEIEKEAFEKTKLRSDVVTLYQGGEYHLYQYKVYTDVRLVFAPEQSIAFFGGDPDNFEFPRHNLDMCIFRVYENGKPANIQHYLKWSDKGVQEGDLIFVSGHPGRTNRMYSMDALSFLRDYQFKYLLGRLHRRENILNLFRQESAANEQIAADDFFGTQNSRKAYTGMSQGLQDLNLFRTKQAAEYALQSQIMTRHPGDNELLDAWKQLANAQEAHKKILVRRALLSTGHAFDSRLFQIARLLMRHSSTEGAGRASLEQDLFSTAPISKELDIALLTDSLQVFSDTFGSRSPLVTQVLHGRKSDEIARELVEGSSLDDVNVRKLIAKGGKAALKASYDPMIQLAMAMDGAAKRAEKDYQTKVAEVERQAYAKIAGAIFEIRGKTTYPDATFTLRLSFGTVKGYTDSAKKAVAAQTTFSGLFDEESQHSGHYPWELPTTWKRAKDQLNPATPFNFVSTADIIGGNSGSPVLNREGELVGLIFDGNIESLTANYVYDDKVSRAVSVHSAGMLEALQKVYGAQGLAKELGF